MRINSIDTLKVAAILGVICLHTGPFGDSQYTGSFFRIFAFGVNQTARFAVPFFFLASGFFFGKSLRSGAQPRELFLRYFWRLIVVFAAWSLIYAVVPSDFSVTVPSFELFHSQLTKTIHWAAENPFTFMLQGTRIHLWFLSTLVISLFLLTLFITAQLQRYVIYFAIALYTIHLLIGPYSGTDIGLPYNLHTINTPLTGFLFTIIGWSLAYRQVPRALFAYLLLIGGFILHNAEAAYLHHHYNSDLSEHHYLIGTVPFALGVFLICLVYPHLGKDTFLPSLGMFTLGVYVVHYLAMDVVSSLSRWIQGPIWELTFPFLVYLLSLGITFLLAQSKHFRPIVI